MRGVTPAKGDRATATFLLHRGQSYLHNILHLAYCVQTFVLHAANITEHCTQKDQPSFGQTCDEFLQV